MLQLLALARVRLVAALGAAAVGVVLAGATPVPSPFAPASSTSDVRACDEPGHAGDDSCVAAETDDSDDSDDGSTTSSSTTTSTTAEEPTDEPDSAASSMRTVQAGSAGSIVVAVDGAGLRLLTTSPNGGWTVEVDQAIGREIEVRFRSGSIRVDVNVEIEDGQVRERVRMRNEATDERTETLNGVPSDDDDDRSGSSGHDDDDDDDHDDDDDDDSSGSGSGDDDSSGHGSDDD